MQVGSYIGSAGTPAPLCTPEDIRHFFAKDFAAHVWSCLECRNDPACSALKASECISKHRVPSLGSSTSTLTDVYRIGNYINPKNLNSFAVAVSRAFHTTEHGGVIVPDYTKPISTNDESKVPSTADFYPLTSECADLVTRVYVSGLMDVCESKDEVTCRRNLRSYTAETKADGSVVETSLLNTPQIATIHSNIDLEDAPGKEFCVQYNKAGSALEITGLAVLPAKKSAALDLQLDWADVNACEAHEGGARLIDEVEKWRRELNERAEKAKSEGEQGRARRSEAQVVDASKEAVEFYTDSYLPKAWPEMMAATDLDGLFQASDSLRRWIDDLSTLKTELQAKVSTLDEQRRQQAEIDGLKTDDERLEGLSKRVKSFVAQYSDAVLYRRTLKITGNTAYYYQRGLYKDDDCDKLPAEADVVAMQNVLSVSPLSTLGDKEGAEPNVAKTREGCLVRRSEFQAFDTGLVEVSNLLRDGDQQANALLKDLAAYRRDIQADKSVDEKERARRVGVVDKMTGYIPPQYQVEGTKKVNRWQNEMHEAAKLQLEREGYQRREQKSNEVWEDALKKLNEMIIENEKAALLIEKEMAEAEAQQRAVEQSMEQAAAAMAALQAVIDEQQARIQRLQELNNDPEIFKTFLYTGAAFVGVGAAFGLYMTIKNKRHGRV